MIPTFVDVSGFFTSGSSAAVDLLKEYSGFFECQAEIRFIKDPAGLCDLENALISNWELINSSAAISDFLAMSRKWGRGNSKNPFSPCGLCYNKKLNRNYVTYSEELIDELVDYTYKMDYYHYKFKKQYPKYIFDRWRWAIEYLSNGKK